MLGRARRELDFAVGRSEADVSEDGRAVTGTSDVEGTDPGLNGAHTESVHSMNIPSFMKCMTKQEPRQPALRREGSSSSGQ